MSGRLVQSRARAQGCKEECEEMRVALMGSTMDDDTHKSRSCTSADFHQAHETLMRDQCIC